MSQPLNFVTIDQNMTQSVRQRSVWVYGVAVGGVVGVCATILFFLFFYTPTNMALLNVAMILLRIQTPVPESVVEVVPTPPVPLLVSDIIVPSTTAFSYIVEDEVSGTVLLSQKPDAQWPLASITKLMTALVILDHVPDWATTTVVVGADSLDSFMYAGDTYTYEELWDAMLIGSSNKAALTLATAIGGDEASFVAQMNEKARALGLSTSTVFSDVSGLSDENKSTARDVAILVQRAMAEEKIASTVRVTEMALFSQERNKRRDIWTTNWLLTGWIPNTLQQIGGKTGHTIAAAYNFTMITNDEANTRPLSVVVLGAQTHEARFSEALALAQTAWKYYQWP